MKAYVQLHVGKPGSRGIDNRARGLKRKRVVLSEPRAGLVINTNELRWHCLFDDQFSHFSLWSEKRGGDHLINGSIVLHSRLRAYDDFVIVVGDLDCDLEEGRKACRFMDQFSEHSDAAS